MEKIFILIALIHKCCFAVDVMKINLDTKTSALGDSQITYIEPLSGVCANPANILARNINIGVSYVKWLSDIHAQSAGCVIPVSENTCVGASVFRISSHGFDEINSDGKPTGNVLTYSDTVFTFALARKLKRNLIAGISVKSVIHELDENTANSTVANLGLIFTPLKDFSIGALIKNLGAQTKPFNEHEELIPAVFGVGVNYNPYYDKNQHIRLYVDITNRKYAFGIEWNILEIFSIRFGYKGHTHIDNLTFGIGFSSKKIIRNLNAELDYAFIPYGNLSDVHRIGLILKF